MISDETVIKRQKQRIESTQKGLELLREENELLQRKYKAAIDLVWEAYYAAGFPVIDTSDIRKIEEMK